MTDILETVSALRSFVSEERNGQKKIAFVPTMGALHEGHLSLVREALKRADVCIVSIFVNPTQFGSKEDFSAYPRTWDADLEKLKKAGAQAVFYPGVREMYPDGFATTVSVKGVSEPLEGEHRPGHFDGVATVVSKLLLQCLPDVALFGEKDWQQLQVIRRLASDLNIPVGIVGIPTVRDENGLALSSRNAYLSAEQYKVAIRLNKIMSAIAEKTRKGASISDVEAQARADILKSGFDSVDYCTIRDAETLREASAGRPWRILAAVRLGRTRLIDNMPV